MNLQNHYPRINQSDFSVFQNEYLVTLCDRVRLFKSPLSHLAILCVFLTSSLGLAAEIMVNADGTGTCPTIQSAIDLSVAGDVILLAPGAYTGHGNRDVDFKGKAITVTGATGDPNHVIINCQGSETDPHRGFRFTSGEGFNSILSAVTILNGYAPAEDVYDNGDLYSCGGAVLCLQSSPVIKDCIVRNCSALEDGGGFYSRLSSPTIKNCIVTNNHANRDGGGISHGAACESIIEDCYISGNSADSGGGINRGHIITGCVITANSAQYSGGATNDGGLITDCLISGNSAGKGGASMCPQTVSKCVVTNNRAISEDGGGIYTGWNSIIENCMIVGNSAAQSGGGICNISNNSSPKISNCVIRNNSARNYGNGIFSIYSSPSISNCTIINNSGAYWGSGIANLRSPAKINNCIIWGNSVYNYESDVSITYSNLETAYAGQGNISADPLFGPDRYHLTSSSPCIDAGDPAYMVQNNETDIDGHPRMVGRIDIGADEIYDGKSPCLAVFPQDITFRVLLNSGLHSQQVTIKNYGLGVLNWQITKPVDCDWLRIAPLAGQVKDGNRFATLIVDPAKAGYGVHTCLLQVWADGAANNPQYLRVTLNVLQPGIRLDKTSFNFTALGKTDPAVPVQQLTINNSGYDTLNWHVELPQECNWIDFAPLSGQVPAGGSCTVAIKVDPNKAPSYDHNSCRFNIVDENASNSPQSVAVFLDVLRPRINLLPPVLYMQAEKNSNVEKSFKIINGLATAAPYLGVSCDILNWQIDQPNDCGWLKFEPASGICRPGIANKINVIADTNGLANGEYTIDVPIRSPEALNSNLRIIMRVYTPAVIHVPADYNTIQAAVDAAALGDKIIVHPGTYAGFFISKPVSLIQSSEPENPAIVESTIIESSVNSSIQEKGWEFTLNGLNLQYRPAGANTSLVTGVNTAYADAVIKNCIISNFPDTGIYIGRNSSAKILNCRVAENGYGYGSNSAGICVGWVSPDTQIKNCLIANNYSAGIAFARVKASLPYNTAFVDITNSTIADNGPAVPSTVSCPGIMVRGNAEISISNSIIRNSTDINTPEICFNASSQIARLAIDYSLIKRGFASVSAPNNVNIVWGKGNIDADPCFVQNSNIDSNNTPESVLDDVWTPGDFHLRSQGWRWNQTLGYWTWDDQTSRAIDAGSPACPLGNELAFVPDDPDNLWGENLRIDMGCYGGTTHASMPPYGWALFGDINNDGTVNLTDFSHLAPCYSLDENTEYGDLNHDGAFGLDDINLLIADWLGSTVWAF